MRTAEEDPQGHRKNANTALCSHENPEESHTEVANFLHCHLLFSLQLPCRRFTALDLGFL